jgi:APA family basic amino acid/polyamine antiporter
LYLLTPLGWTGEYRVKFAAAAIIFAVTVPNLLGHRHSAWTQNLTTIVKLGLFVGLVAAAFLHGGGRFSHLVEGEPLETVDLKTAATQLFYVMFAYSGWNAAGYLAGEVKDPAKTLPRSLLLGTVLVVLLYLALNFVFAYAVPSSKVGFDNAERVPQLAVENLFGARAAAAFSVALGLTFLATVSAFVITGSRVYYAMARDGLFPSVAAHTSSRAGVPTYAMILQSVCATAILFVTDFQNLYRYAAVGVSLFALLFIGAVYVLRVRRPDLKKPFHLPGYPIVPALFMMVTVFMAVFAFMEWPKPSLLSLGSILLGIPAYYVWTWLRHTSGSTPDSQ